MPPSNPGLDSPPVEGKRRGVTTRTVAITLTLALVVAAASAWWLTRPPLYTDIITGHDTDAGDWYGSSVAISGTTIAIGAYRDGDTLERRGTVYLVELSGASDGALEERAKLISPAAAAGDQAGFSVALHGDWLAVGAIGDFGKQALGRSEGRVDVWRRTDESWRHHAALTRRGAEADDRFGFSLALHGETLAVGARGVNEGRGAVYVHRLDEPDLAPLELKAPDAEPGDRFGEALAFDGRTLLVGAPGRDGQADDAGAVFAFAADAAGNLSETAAATLTAPDPAGAARFGVGVGVSGDVAVIGASHWAADGAEGRVWLATLEEGEWGSPLELSAADAAAGDMNGFRVAIDGELAAASAHLDDVRGTDSGSVLLFGRTVDGWRLLERLAPPDGDAGDAFGIALAVGDGTVVIGAEQADVNGEESGGVYLHTVSGGRPDETS